MAAGSAQTLQTIFKSDPKQLLDTLATIKTRLKELKDGFNVLGVGTKKVAKDIDSVGKTFAGNNAAIQAYIQSLSAASVKSTAYLNAVKYVQNATKGMQTTFTQAAEAVRTTGKALTEAKQKYAEYLSQVKGVVQGTKEWRTEMARFSTGAQLGRASLAQLSGELDGSSKAVVAWMSRHKNASQTMKDYVQSLTVASAATVKSAAQTATATAQASTALTAYEKALRSVVKQGSQYAAAFAVVAKGLIKSSTANQDAVRVIRKTDETLAKLKRGFADYLIQVKGVSRWSKTFSEQIAAIGQGTNLTKAALAVYTGEIKNNTQSLARWIALSKTLASGNLKDYAAGLDKVGKAAAVSTPKVSRFSGLLGGLGDKLRTLSQYALVANAIYKIVAAFKDGVDEIIQFDQALRNLQAISGEPFYKIQVMAETLKDVARETKFSTRESAEGMVLLAQSGFDASEALNTIRATANLAAGTLSDFRMSADILTTSIRAFKIETIEAGMVADVWANAVNKSKLSIDKIRIAMNYIGVAASQAGVGLEESAAAMMLMANRGARASTIGTGFRQVLSKLLNPSNKLRDALHGVGLTLDDINPNIDEAGNKMTGFEEAMEVVTALLVDAKTGAVDMGKAFEFFQLRGAQAASVLADAFATGSEFKDAVAKVKEVGTSMDMAATQSKGLGYQLKNLGDRARTLMVSLGEAGLADAFRMLISFLSGLTIVAEALVKSTLVSLTVQIGALTVGLMGLNKMAKMATLANLSTVLTTVGINATALSVKMTALKVATAGFLTGGFTAAIATMTASFKNLATTLGKHPILLVAGTLAVVAKLAYSLSARNLELADTYSKISVENRKAFETLTGYSGLLRAAGDDAERFNNVLKRMTKEQPELIKNIQAAVGALDLSQVKDKQKIFEAIDVENAEKIKVTIDAATVAVKRLAAETKYYNDLKGSYSQSIFNPTDVRTGQKIKELTTDYKIRVLQLADAIKAKFMEQQKANKGDADYVEKIKQAQVESLKYVGSLEDVKEEGVAVKAALNDLFDGLIDSAKIGVKQLPSIITKMPQAFQKAFDELGVIEKGGFVQLVGQINSRISAYERQAKNIKLQEEDIQKGAAAIRAKGLAEFIADNDKTVGIVISREERIAEIIEGFIDQSVVSSREGVEERKVAENELVGFFEIVNTEYIKGIKDAYAETAGVIKDHLSNLEGQFSNLQGKLEGVSRSIASAQKKYAGDLRDIQQKSMTEEEIWLNDREEANRLMAEGVKNQNIETLKEAQNMFKTLAKEVKDENSKTTVGMKEATDQATAGMAEAHGAIMGILSEQKDTLEKDIGSVGKRINEAKSLLDTYRDKVREVSREKLLLDTSELKGIFKSAIKDLADFKKALSEQDVEMNIRITGEASDRKLLGEKLPEVRKEVDDFIKETNGKKATVRVDVSGGEGLKSISDVITLKVAVEEAKGRSFKKFLYDMQADLNDFVKKSKARTNELVGFITKTYSKAIGAKNIFKAIFIGREDTGEQYIDSLVTNLAKGFDKISDTASKIGKLSAFVQTGFNAPEGQTIPEHGQATIESLKSIATAISAVKSSFITIFSDSEGVPLNEAIPNTIKNLFDFATSISSFKTNFQVLFEDTEGGPLSTRMHDIMSETSSFSEAVNGMFTTLRVDFLTNDGLPAAMAIEELGSNFLGLSDLVNNITSVFTTSFLGWGSTERPISEKIQEVKGWIIGLSKTIKATTSKFVTQFISADGMSLSTAMSWLGMQMGAFSKTIEEHSPKFVTDFVDQHGGSLSSAIGDIAKKFLKLSLFTKSLKMVLSFSFLSDGGFTVEQKIDMLKQKFMILSSAIRMIAKELNMKFQGKFLTDLVDSVTRLLGDFPGLNAAIKKFFGEMGSAKKMLESFPGVGYALEKIFTGADEQTTSIKDKVISVLKFIISAIADFIVAMTGGADSPFKVLFDSIIGQFEQASSTITGMKTLYKVAITSNDDMPIEDKLAATLGSIQKVRDTINGTKAALKIAIMSDRAGVTIPGVFGEIIHTYNQFVDAIREGDLFGAMSIGADAAYKVFNLLKEVFKDLEAEFAGLTFAEGWEKGIDLIKTKMGDLGQLVGDQVDKITKAFTGILDTSFVNRFDELKDKAVEILSFIGKAIADFIIKMTGGADSPFVAIFDSIKMSFDMAVQQAGDASNTIRGLQTLFKISVTDENEMSFEEKLNATVGSVQKAKEFFAGLKAYFVIAVVSDRLGMPVEGVFGEIAHAYNMFAKEIKEGDVFGFMAVGAKLVVKTISFLVSSLHTDLSKGFADAMDSISEFWLRYATLPQRAAASIAKTIEFLKSPITYIRSYFTPATESIETFANAAARMKTAVVKGVTALSKFKPSLAGLLKGFGLISKALSLMTKGFSKFIPFIGQFLMSWDIGQAINDMDLFGLLPMRLQNYFQIAIGYLDMFRVKIIEIFAGTSEALADMFGLSWLADMFGGWKAEANTTMDAINDTIATINPVAVKMDDSEARSSGAKLKRFLENTFSEAWSYYTIKFRGQGSTETGAMDKIAQIGAGLDGIDKKAAKGSTHTTSFKDGGGTGLVDILKVTGAAIEKGVKDAAEAQKKLDKIAAKMRSTFRNMFTIEATGGRGSAERITSDMYKEMQDFYDDLDGMRKINFGKFWQDTEKQVATYKSLAKQYEITQAKQALQIDLIRRQSFEKFKKISEEEAALTRASGIANVVSEIEKNTEAIEKASASKIAAYQREVKELEIAQLKLSQTEADTADVDAYSDKMQSIQIEMAKTRVDAIRDSLGISQSLLEEYAEKEKNIAKGTLTSKKLSTDKELSVVREGLTREQIMEAEFQVERARFWEMNTESAVTHGIDIVKVRQQANDAMSQLYQADSQAQQTERDKAVTSTKKYLEDVEKTFSMKGDMELPFMFDAAKLELMKQSFEGVSGTATKMWKEVNASGANMSFEITLESIQEMEDQLYSLTDTFDEMGRPIDEAGKQITATFDKLAQTDIAVVFGRPQLLEMMDAFKGVEENAALAFTQIADGGKEMEFWLDKSQVEEMAESFGYLDLKAGKAVQGVVDSASEMTKAQKAYADEVKKIDKEVAKKKIKSFEAARQALETELDKSLDKEKEIAGEIRSLRQTIADEQKSTEEKIRDLKRGLMTEESAYNDKWKEVAEMKKKAAALSDKDAKASIELYKKAKAAAAGLAQEIKEGDKIIVSKKSSTQKVISTMQSLDKAMAKVVDNRTKELEKQQDKVEDHTNKIKDSMQKAQMHIDTLTKHVEEKLSGSLDEVTEKAKKFMDMFDQQFEVDLDTSAALSKIGQLQQKLKDLNSQVSESASAAASAAASATPGFASGGSVFGPGGIDKVLARLTKDEFVQPVASVRAYGQDVMEGFRHRMFPVENVRALLAAGRQKLSNVSARASQLDLSGMRPKTTITQPQMTMPTIIHPSTVKGYAGGGSVSDMGMPRIKNMGSLEFAAAGPGPQIFGSVSALEMLKAQILNEKKRSFNG